LCYAEHEKGEANAAYVSVLTGECRVIAGFRCHKKQEKFHPTLEAIDGKEP
jgi:hypothetical protein